MRGVAASAIKWFARSRGVLQNRSPGISRCLLAYGRLAGGRVLPVRGIGMALEAQGDRFFQEQRHLVRSMGRMAGQATASSHGRMNNLPGKTGLVMAGKT